jgi:chromosome segregation ATPase
MVERFTPCDWPHATMVEDSDGGYVSYYDYEKLQQRLATVEAVSRNRLETILLIHGCYFDACFEAESILFDLSKAEAERDQAIKEIGRIGRELGTTQAERDELQRHCESYISAYDAILADLKIMEKKLSDLEVENSRLIRIGEERHIRAKDTEEGLMEHVERLQAENERLLRCLADYPAGNQTEPDVKAALREVDGGKD